MIRDLQERTGWVRGRDGTIILFSFFGCFLFRVTTVVYLAHI